MKDEWAAFSKRLAEAMREAGYEPRPSVLFRQFNTKYRGESVSFQSVSRWLNGRSIPEQDKLQVLAGMLGVSPQHLRFGTPAGKVAEPRLAWPMDVKPGDRETFDAYLRLSPAHRKLVREIIAALHR
ncbi:MAG TPA: helix-turn-helix domain-containing protein [Rudaea sp.]|nr:helix-turn-helix domain-containing protein [Rudaea sp.]